MATIRVQITAVDIAEATGGDYDCPIARAIKRAVPNAKSVKVGWTRLSIDHWSMPLPKELRNFVNRFFVSRAACRPFAFEIDLPAEVAA